VDEVERSRVAVAVVVVVIVADMFAVGGWRVKEGASSRMPGLG